MKNRRFLSIVVVVVLAGAAWYCRGAGPAQTAIPLLSLYPEAEKRSNLPVEQAYALIDVTIDGETRPSIFMHPTSRLTFKGVVVPRHAWLRVWLALRPEVWDRPAGDGVLFRFGVSDGRTYENLARQYVDPRGHRADRRWIPLTIDLSAYAGIEVDLIFNTESTLPGRADDPANDWAVWGAPEIVVRR